MKLMTTLCIMVFALISTACNANGGNSIPPPEKIFDGKQVELAKAISAGDVGEIESSIKNGANPNGVGKEGVTPLVWAMYNKNKPAMIALLMNGADPNMRITTPDAHYTLQDNSAVTFIAGATDNEYLEILLDHEGDMNAKTSAKEPILHAMIFNDPTNYEGMKMLLDRGADINATDSGGSTLLVTLADLNDFEHVYYLLERGADYTIKDGTGYGADFNIFQEKIDTKDFPEAYEWQRKCQEFLKARGVKDSGPMKPLSAEEKEEWDRRIEEAFEAQARKREQQ